MLCRTRELKHCSLSIRYGSLLTAWEDEWDILEIINASARNSRCGIFYAIVPSCSDTACMKHLGKRNIHNLEYLNGKTLLSLLRFVRNGLVALIWCCHFFHTVHSIFSLVTVTITIFLTKDNFVIYCSILMSCTQITQDHGKFYCLNMFLSQ